MTSPVLTPISILLSALEAEAAEAIGEAELVTVDFERISNTDGSGEVSVKRLKASSRTCFLQADISVDGSTVFKGRAVFKAKSAPNPG